MSHLNVLEVCKICEKGFLTESDTYKTEEGGLIKLIWCSNALCDYNERKQVFQNYK